MPAIIQENLKCLNPMKPKFNLPGARKCHWILPKPVDR
jgi:hypothetical protein